MARIFDIDSMPRGGPDASWLDRRLQTDRLEYLDRDDVDDLKRRVVRALDRSERIFGRHKKSARIALDEVADMPDPRIPGSPDPRIPGSSNSAPATARYRARC
jgi:hypothetical protein